eukprot:CAMPEP_0119288080 /NCGR_PEP_ID=MMETSP1329-20130426/36606_1 /TAXON_ID=114041 /ORGANISM="Genus nov. species nov., Strain RCC1024" /LENGTH=74 /DNA_ID=CAMNT_0007288859 /DNA_START=102 /DNA_END=323 /DNA_ORIENTATION=+
MASLADLLALSRGQPPGLEDLAYDEEDDDGTADRVRELTVDAWNSDDFDEGRELLAAACELALERLSATTAWDA